MSEAFPHGYALLIGVGACAYAPWSLPTTVRDAQAMAAILADPALCGYRRPHPPVHDAGAARQAILNGLAWLAGRATADGDATAVVYFSGHGWLDETGASAQPCARYSLIPHDSHAR